MKTFTMHDDLDDFFDAILVNQTPEKQIEILRNCLASTLDHGWVDEPLKDALLDNIAQQYDIPYEEEAEE
jgi:hypothetical protein